MQRLAHGYTNDARRNGDRVEKRFRGKDAAARCSVERACLASLADRVPVPKLFGWSAERITMAFVDGDHGQDLVDAGEAGWVLQRCGSLLRALQDIAHHDVQSVRGDGDVIVHGDFGPQNILFDHESRRPIALLDWEFAHLGDRIEDLAWTEWIVRMHHPSAMPELGHLFAGYGEEPRWSDRHEAMLVRCTELITFAERTHGAEARAMWRQRRTATESWA